MRISDWSSDVCSSDLRAAHLHHGVVDGAVEFLPAGEEGLAVAALGRLQVVVQVTVADMAEADQPHPVVDLQDPFPRSVIELGDARDRHRDVVLDRRSEEHTSELQSLMRISYAVFCWKKKKTKHKRGPARNRYTK